ncbi:IS1380 family transposase [Streptomyces scopuliridis]|uniref:IS1380 family transposase n=1 Tax=Streptomyces scopuliridis TaxID=452529 RepID=UPI0036A6F1C9
MQSSHAAAAVSSAFDDPNLIAYGGLEPVVRLAERCGLPALVGEHVRLPDSKDSTGAFPAAKLMSLVGGMAAGADSIDDMDRLRHGAMGRLFSGVRAPSTLGSFLRSFTHGHVKQLHAVARRFLHELARHTPLLPGADQAAYVDIDDTIRRTHGYAKQGAGYGYSKVKGLNALLGVVSTPLSAPVIAATRLRKGPSNSARGAAALVAETIRTARACGASGLLVLRADSAFYGADVINACRALGARFSITMRMNASVKATIARIDEDAWTPADPLTLPDRPARKVPRPVDKVEELGRPAATPCPNPQLSPNTACTTPKRSTGNQAGGSGLRLGTGGFTDAGELTHLNEVRLESIPEILREYISDLLE